MADRTPPGPSTTARTSGSSPTQVKTRSAFADASAGVAVTLPPCSATHACPGRGAVEYRDLVPGALQPAGHGIPYDPEPDECHALSRAPP
jgi:hypothetical protein